MVKLENEEYLWDFFLRNINESHERQKKKSVYNVFYSIHQSVSDIVKLECSVHKWHLFSLVQPLGYFSLQKGLVIKTTAQALSKEIPLTMQIKRKIADMTFLHVLNKNILLWILVFIHKSNQEDTSEKHLLADVSICVVYRERSAWFSPRQV